MLNDPEEILGEGKKLPLVKSQPILEALTADAGPDIPGGEGANRGFWRRQLRDPKTKQFIPMGAFIICNISIPGKGTFKATGTFSGNKKLGVATIEISGNKDIPDGKYQVPHGDVLGSAKAVIPKEDLARALDKVDGVIDDPKNAIPDSAKMAGEPGIKLETPKPTTVKKDLTGFTKISNNLGSNEGGLYKDPTTGEEFYVKFGETARLENEALASDIYKLAGLNSTDLQLGTMDKKPVIYSPWVEGLNPDLRSKIDAYGSEQRSGVSASMPRTMDSLSAAQQGFAVDAWLANWDVVGSAFDNLVFDKDGKPLRVDPGGALLYRARGDLKGDKFGNEVTELETFVRTSHAGSGNTANDLYRITSRPQRLQSAKLVQKISPEQIEALVDSRITNPEDNKLLKERLLARREYIIDYFSLNGFDETKQQTTDNEDILLDKIYYNDLNKAGDLLTPGKEGGPKVSTDLSDTSGYLDRYFDENAPLVDAIEGSDIKNILQATSVKRTAEAVLAKKSIDEVNGRAMNGDATDVNKIMLEQHKVVYDSLAAEDAEFAKQFPDFKTYAEYLIRDLAIDDKLFVGAANETIEGGKVTDTIHADWGYKFTPEQFALQKKINSKYAEKILKLKPGGKIRIYRNANATSYQYKSRESAASGYWSFDPDFAGSFNARQSENYAIKSAHSGRYSSYIKAEDVVGIIGIMRNSSWEYDRASEMPTILDEMPLSLTPNDVINGGISDLKYHGNVRDVVETSGSIPWINRTGSSGDTPYRSNRGNISQHIATVPFNLDELKQKAKEKGIDLDKQFPEIGAAVGGRLSTGIESRLILLPDGRYEIDPALEYKGDLAGIEKLIYLQKELDIPLISNRYTRDEKARKIELDFKLPDSKIEAKQITVADIEKHVTVPEPTAPDESYTLTPDEVSNVSKIKSTLDALLDTSKEMTGGDNLAHSNLVEFKAKYRSKQIDQLRTELAAIYAEATNRGIDEKKLAEDRIAQERATIFSTKIENVKGMIASYEQMLKDDPAAKEWAPKAIETLKDQIVELEAGYDRDANLGHRPFEERIADTLTYYLPDYDKDGSIREKILSGASNSEVLEALEKTDLWKQREEQYQLATKDSKPEDMWLGTGTTISENEGLKSSLTSAYASDTRLSAEENEVERKEALESLRNGQSSIELPSEAEATPEVKTPEAVEETPKAPEVEAPAVETPKEVEPTPEPKKAADEGWEQVGTNLGRGESKLLDDAIDTDLFDYKYLEGNKHQPSEKDALTEPETESIKLYTQQYYRGINKYLRNNKFVADSQFDTEDKLKEAIKNLDDAIEEHPAVDSDGFRVFRGMLLHPRYTTDGVNLADQYEELQPGDIVEEKSFISTSSKPRPAYALFGPASSSAEYDRATAPLDGGSAFWSIDTPKGSKLLPLPTELSRKDEEEVLLPRNTKLKIKAIRKVAQVRDGEETGDYNYFFEAEVVPSNVPEEEKPDATAGELATKKQVRQLILLYNEVEDKEAKKAIFEAAQDKNLTSARAKELLEADYSPKPAPEVPKEMAERFFNPKYGAGESKTDVAMLPIDEVEKYVVLDRAGKDSWGESSDATIAKITEELKNGGSIRDPLVIDYDDENDWGALSEGHHRLIAARQAGLKYVPVRILRAQGQNKSFKNKGKGAPLTYTEGPDKFGYIPGAAHASRFDQFAEDKPVEPKLEKTASYDTPLSSIEDSGFLPNEDVIVYAKVPKDAREGEIKSGTPVTTDKLAADKDLGPDEKVVKLSIPARNLLADKNDNGPKSSMVYDSRSASESEKKIEEGGGFVLKPEPGDVAPESPEPEKPEEPEKEPPVTHTFNGKTYNFSSEEMENARYYVSKNYMGAKDVSDEEGKEFNERMRALTDYLRPGQVSDETIAGQEKLLGPGTKIKVGELRHSAPPSRFDEIISNGIRPKITDKVGTERYSQRRFGVFLANDYTSTEAGELGEVFRVKVPESDLRVDSGYTPYGQNMYVERTIKPEEIEHLGHIPAKSQESEVESKDAKLHSGRGTECTICNPELKALEPEKESEPKTPEQLEEARIASLHWYTDSGYEIANDHLRNGTEISPEEKEKVDNLVKMLESSKTVQSMQVLRGIEFFDEDEKKDIESIKPGDVLYDSAIASATSDDDVAERYTNMNPEKADRARVIFKINLPVGSKAYTLKNGESSQGMLERETLIAPGVKMKVKSVEVKDGIRYIEFEAESPDGFKAAETPEVKKPEIETPKGQDFSAIGYSKEESIKDFLDPKNGAVVALGDTVIDRDGKSVIADEEFFKSNDFITYRSPSETLSRYGTLIAPKEGTESPEALQLRTDWIEQNKKRFIYTNLTEISRLAFKKMKELGYTDNRSQNLYYEGIRTSLLNYEAMRNKLLSIELLDYVYENYPESQKGSEAYKKLEKRAEFQKKLAAYTEVVKKANVTVAIEGNDLVSALEAGRIKNQFETGQSRGTFNPEMRIKNELVVSGTPIDTPDSKRSIFGYLTIYEDEKRPASKISSTKKNILHVGNSYTRGYGKFKVIMKPSVKERTTFTANDSLGGGQIAQPVTSNLDSEAAKMAGLSADQYTTLNYTPESVIGYYLEAQIHGGVSLSDIEKIIYTFDASRDDFDAETPKDLMLVKNKLAELGISIPLEVLILGHI